MSSIFPKFTKSHILEALNLYASGHPHEFGDSTKYDVIYNGRRFPPKAIVGLAAVPLTGKPLTGLPNQTPHRRRRFRLFHQLRHPVGTAAPAVHGRNRRIGRSPDQSGSTRRWQD
jgi:5-methylcytosine-specific restriction protein A